MSDRKADPRVAELFPSLERLARKRRGRVPFVQQLEAADCGAACLAMVLAHFGRDTSLDEVREAIGGSGRDGTDAATIMNAGEWYGLRGRGIGSQILRALLQEARRTGFREPFLHAQLQAVPFYEKFGFSREGEGFDESGIPHVRMSLVLE